MEQRNAYQNPKAIKFVNGAQRVFAFRTLMFFQIPLLWYSGIKVQVLNRSQCTVSLPFTRRTKNPFKSVYFAAQCMAAELSTGLIVMAETLETGKKWSMLVTSLNASFLKKADHELQFSCHPNEIISNAISQSLEKKEPVKFILKSEGKLPDGTLAAVFELEWSLKCKE